MDLSHCGYFYGDAVKWRTKRGVIVNRLEALCLPAFVTLAHFPMFQTLSIWYLSFGMDAAKNVSLLEPRLLFLASLI